VFVTSARSGWRDLDRVLKVQGFDEVVDANTLKALYPEASLGIWGVWDSYVFDYLKTRMKQTQSDDLPLFVFVLTSTNHPPYDLPSNYQRLERDMRIFRGEVNADTIPNLHTYHYATDLLGDFVQHMQTAPNARSTVLAATGDHNVRSFGLYATPERRYLAGQVPFVIWGADHCGEQEALPASHRDMFPTLLPMLGISTHYFNTGRNLLAKPAPQDPMQAPMSLSYTGTARDAHGVWNLGDPGSHVCSPPSAGPCEFPASSDAQARARLGLLDWLVRVSLKPAQK
jgi:phosphoglycerol transferase MdoB-like AlkP superfamily enzyme